VTLIGLGGKSQDRLVASLGAEHVRLVECHNISGVTRSMTYAMRLPRVLKEVKRRFSFDAMHFVNYSLDILAYPLVRALSLGPIVTDIHSLGSARFIEPGVPKPASVWGMSLILEKITMRLSHAVITPTEELRNFFLTTYGRSSKIFAVPNCYWSSNAESESLAGQSSIDKQSLVDREGSMDFTILFHANFLPRSLSVRRSLREVERLLWIVEQVRKRGHRIRLWVAGPGSDAVRGPEYVISLGYVENLAFYVSGSDLIILPVEDRTLGIHSRLVEAMANGKPVVATREACCGLLPYIGDSGVLMCDSLQEMVESVCSLLEDPMRMRILGKRNRELAGRLFSLEAIRMQLELAYHAVLNNARARRRFKVE
jgi:glycosyltransferase involved in cell wall biosynthesis